MTTMMINHSDICDAVNHNDDHDDEGDPPRTSLVTLFVVAMVARMRTSGSLSQLT